DVFYGVLEYKKRTLLKFDDDIYFGEGNDVRFGLVSLLGGSAKQAVVSQDIPRGGTQWIVTLGRRPRIIFDGPRWSVGGEGDDMRIVDLDGDGVYEVSAPIADFYQLQDKMSISQIPLPEIVFRYDNRLRTYLPANRHFQPYLLKQIGGPNDSLNSSDPLEI